MVDEGELAEKLLSLCLLICESWCNHVNQHSLASDWRKVSYFYCGYANEDTSLSVCVCLCAWGCHTHCQFGCPCASRNHKLYRIIPSREYHTDKVKPDISTVCRCMRVHVCVHVDVWVYAHAHIAFIVILWSQTFITIEVRDLSLY